MASAYQQNEAAAARDGSSSDERGSTQEHYQHSVLNATDHNYQETNDTTSSVMGAPLPYIAVPTAPNNPTLAPTTPFTAQNLATHNHQQDHQVSDQLSSEVSKLDTLRLNLLHLGINLPDYILLDMARSYDGMIPIERFLAEYEDSNTQAMMREEYYAMGAEQYGSVQFHDEDLRGWQEG